MSDFIHYHIDEYYLDLQRQAQEMKIDEESGYNNPFPGLRSYRTSEAHLFFGRAGQSDELIRRLMQKRFLAVLGNSGSGKSSLVRAGLIPAIHAGMRQTRPFDWKIAICRPGNKPLESLAAALAGASLQSIESSVIATRASELLVQLRESSFGLLDIEAETYTADHKTLLIIDQFEELFRFDKEIDKGEAASFVNLLLTAINQEHIPVYVVITMRSEFLGECVRFRGLPEIINEGQYLVPRLTSDNIRHAIKDPLAMVGATIEPTLVNRLLNELGDDMDQLPLLQHALMRTYQHWQNQGGGRPLSHADYIASGGILKALSLHADEVYDALDEQGHTIARLLFQRLTDLTAGNMGGRLPTRMDEIYGIASALPASQEEVNQVIEQFRRTEASFLMPPPGAILQPESIVDIAHESLIPNWDRLTGWAKEETENGRLYQRLQQAYDEDQQGLEQGLIKGALLQRLREWKETNMFNGYWAARYHDEKVGRYNWEANEQTYARNIAFLEACMATEEAERLRQEREQQEQLAAALQKATEEKALRERAETAIAEVVKYILRDIKKDIYATEYEEAFEKVKSLPAFEIQKEEVVSLALELAFWYGEIGQKQHAEEMLAIACKLSGRQRDTSQTIRKEIAASNQDLFDRLYARYYPVSMQPISGGVFEMGCNPDRDGDCNRFIDEIFAQYIQLHPQRVSDFQIAKHEVTWWQYRLYCAQAGKPYEAPGWGIQGDNPVVNVSWYDAIEYANWLSARMRLKQVYRIDTRNKDVGNHNEDDQIKWTVSIDPAANGYRLPFEAEWEYAARGGGQEHWTAKNNPVNAENAWFGDTAFNADSGYKSLNPGNSGGRTQPVEGKKPNSIGVYDMSGNVWEWCWDWFDVYPAAEIADYQGPASGILRVIRGGSWRVTALYCSPVFRDRNNADIRLTDIGFRLARGV